MKFFRYAEEQQDLALLSISTFQRGLKDHNQVKLLSSFSENTPLRPLGVRKIITAVIESQPYF